MRLIDAIPLLDIFKQNSITDIITIGDKTIRQHVYDAPTIDAVPVVRCVDCKYRGTLVCPMCHTETCLDDLDGFDDYNVNNTDDDGFCHLGER